MIIKTYEEFCNESLNINNDIFEQYENDIFNLTESFLTDLNIKNNKDLNLIKFVITNNTDLVNEEFNSNLVLNELSITTKVKAFLAKKKLALKTLFNNVLKKINSKYAKIDMANSSKEERDRLRKNRQKEINDAKQKIKEKEESVLAKINNLMKNKSKKEDIKRQNKERDEKEKNQKERENRFANLLHNISSQVGGKMTISK